MAPRARTTAKAAVFAERTAITRDASPHVKRLLRNFKRRTAGHRTAKRLELLLDTIIKDMLNSGENAMSLSDLLYLTVAAWEMAQSLDARRARLDPSQGGKAV